MFLHRYALSGILLTFAAVSTGWGETMYGLTSTQELVTIDASTRQATSMVALPFHVTGESIMSIDMRPKTGELMGISNAHNLYLLNPTTGSATLIGSGLGMNLTGTIRSMDFNPVVDRIRIVTSSGQNFRANPDTGAIVATDGNLAFDGGDINAGDTPSIVSAAYTNSRSGALTTTLYTMDAGNDILTTQNPPNAGVLNSVGPVGFDLVDFGGFTGFDVSGKTGMAYLVGSGVNGTGLTENSLYTVDLGTGQATLAGSISGLDCTLMDIAVVPEVPSLWLAAGVASVWLARYSRQRPRI